MATLQQAIDRVQALVGALDNVREAPDEPPERFGVDIFSVCFAKAGVWGRISDWKRGHHTIVCQLHVAKSRGELPGAIKKSMGFSENIPNAILNDITLNSTVEAVKEVRYTFGEMAWGSCETLGWSFEIDIEQQSGLT